MTETNTIEWVSPELTIQTWENTESMFDFFRCS